MHRLVCNQSVRRGVHLGVIMPAMAKTTETLAERAAVDLDAVFPEIVATYGPDIYSTALRLTAQPADAEDLAAEAFERAYRAIVVYPPERVRGLQLRPWLVTITLNRWRNCLRDASRRPVVTPLGPDVAPPDLIPSPEQTALDRDAARGLTDLLATLPEVQRLSIVLRHVVGLAYPEIATVLDCPSGTVKSHVARGLAALRAALSPEQEGTSCPPMLA